MQSPTTALDVDLRQIFTQWREQPVNQFIARHRRVRASQLRELLADPEKIDLATFNREVWQLGTVALVRPDGTRSIIKNIDELDDSEIAQLTQDLETIRIEAHGNGVWRPASGIYSPQSKDDQVKLQNLQSALDVLNNQALSPIEKAKLIVAVPGFGESTATGLVMMFHPDRFALRNRQSNEAFARLGLSADSLESFEEAAERLRNELGAEDFLELDWFLYQLANGKVEGLVPSRYWWVNQGKTYEDERLDGYLWAPKQNTKGQTFAPWTNMARVQPGDIVLHYSKGEIKAISRVVASAVDAPRPGQPDNGMQGEDGYLVRTVYHDLPQPLSLTEIEHDWRIAEGGPFTRHGSVNQGYLYPVSESFVHKLLARFADRLPAVVQEWNLLQDQTELEKVEVIRKAVENMYPDPDVRRTCLTVLADSIERANAVSLASWATSLSHNQKVLRLNVSWTQACVLSSADLYLVLDADALDASTLEQISAHAVEGHRSGAAYASLPFAYGVHLPTDRLNALLPMVEDAHRSLVARSAQQVRTRTNFHHAHMPEVIDYLRQELSRDLPQPDYGPPLPPTQQVWLFQANPDMWDLTEELRRRQVGDEEHWLVTKLVI